MRFKLRQMEVLRAVMLTGTISGAARMLFVSQPAVSKLVSHLETTLGLRLFDRTGSRLTPTTEAQTLFREIEQVYQAAQRVDDLARSLAVGPNQLLNVSCGASLSTFIAQALVDLHSSLPSIRVDWQTALMSEMPIQLLSKTRDIAVSPLPIVHENLVVVPFMRGRMVCIVPEHHPLKQFSELTLEQLAQETMILFRRDIPMGALIDRACQQVGIELKSMLDVSRAEQSIALVKRGLGIAIVDEFSAQDSGLLVRPLAEEISLTACFVHSRFMQPSIAAMRFMEVVREQARKMGTLLPDRELDEL
ncbi:DNA-binding transcriptional LysR family regulator [Paraburkholderia sp. GAS199]|uniref:LysR family transcriptional regulator n=1 Tax=Paraburkholderia sp. GAS199 TaxID=3035126 RepID=UPI003D235359